MPYLVFVDSSCLEQYLHRCHVSVKVSRIDGGFNVCMGDAVVVILHTTQQDTRSVGVCRWYRGGHSPMCTNRREAIDTSRRCGSGPAAIYNQNRRGLRMLYRKY
jgi:hypothetical protein